MCGIVGYVGPRPALDVVIEGLRRLEYRGYDSAGVAIIGRRRRRCRSRRRPAGSRTWTRSSPRRTDQPGTPASGTPGGPPTARRTTATRTRTPTRPAGSRSCTTASSRTSRELRAELEAAGVEFGQRHRHRDGRPPGRGRSWRAGALALADAVRAGLPPAARARSPWCCSTREQPDVVVARPAQLAAGARASATARSSSAATSPRSSSYTRDAVELGQDQVVEITPRRLHDHRLRRQRRSTARTFHIDWDLAAAEKGGYDYFMLKEIQEQPDAVADTLRGHLVGRADRAGRAAPGHRRSCATSTRSSSSPAAPPTTPG